ncbi:hypothetical protein [Franzmannia qiaohouensis]|uniref:Uncharacterized protein n=1 Tax=Franzmannia qiaohouensis TaxID=1329370 RepID=A0ABU1HGJ9_9GAMM|nr:hypothetical protein [Halomonas qiaohouensis]MDR5906606.1 hypothetical protein [Halomonas qiaohouensis]
MSRVDKIIAHQRPDGLVDSFGIERAFCNCLTPDEAAALLNRVVTEKPEYRNAAVRKVYEDIEKGYLACHERLIEELMSAFKNGDHRLRQSLGFVLSRISEVVPSRIQQRIELFFLDSRYIGVRRRGYKISTRRNKLNEQAIMKPWREYGDYEAAWLITKFFPVSFLIENRQAIEEHFTEGWQFSRLYLRMAEVQPGILSHLKARDTISYSYVLAKLGGRLDDEEAFKFLESASLDERFGLYVWSLGKLGKWEVLEAIDSKLLEFQVRRIRHVFPHYHI